MLKAKLRIWIPLFLILASLQYVGPKIVSVTARAFAGATLVSVKNEMETNKDTINDMYFERFNAIKLKESGMSPDVIITKKEAVDGYRNINHDMISPMVMCINSNDKDANSELFQTMNKMDYYYRVDLKIILDGMKENKTWEDIGVSTKTISGKICITIPKEGTAEYNIVRKLFVQNLNGDEELADKLLGQCNKVINVKNEIYAVKNNNFFKKNDSVFLIPECMIKTLTQESNSPFTKSGMNYFMPVYIENNIYDQYHILVKEDLFNKDRNGMGEQIVNALIRDDDFSDLSGWRISGVDFKFNYYN